MLLEHFDLPDRNWNKEELINLLMPEIEVLLNRNFEKFLLICYRIDLNEEKLKGILSNSKPDELIKDLAVAIVDRQILKAEIKKKYSS